MKLKHCILMAAAVLAGACSTADEPSTAGPAAELCELVFSIDLSATPDSGTQAARAAAARTAAAETTDEGTAAERRIDRLDLYLVTADGRTIGLAPTLLSEINSVYTYKVPVDLNADYVDRSSGWSLSGRLVAIANYPGSTPADPFGASAVSLAAVTADGLIPMWGVSTLNAVPLIYGGTASLGEIRLLRSLPKISIRLDQSTAALYNIVSVSADQQGYLAALNCQPAGAAGATTTADLLGAAAFNPATGSGEASAQRYYGLGTTAVHFYPAERSCPPNGDRPMSYTVTLADKSGAGRFTGKVYLCDYTDAGTPDFGTAFDALVRNNNYDYTIRLRRLELLVSLQQWQFGGKVHLELE